MWLIMLALPAGVAWLSMGTPGWRQAPWMPPDATPKPHATNLHKCKQGAEVVYTDAPCTTAQQTQAMGAGTVTVIPAQRPSKTLPATPASLPNARDLVGDPNQPSLRDQHIDRVVNQ